MRSTRPSASWPARCVFRASGPGKAPRRLLEARLGTEAARRQALQDSLPDYYADAVVSENVDPIAAPSIEITAGARTTATSSSTPSSRCDPSCGSSATTSSPSRCRGRTSSDEDVDRQVDALRERSAELADSDLPLIDGDYATIDIRGSIDGEEVEGLVVSDFLYEVGSRQRRAVARRAAARHVARRDPRVHRHACPIASASSPARKRRSA